MLPTIRTFRNTDVDALCRVWNAHYGDLGYACQIDALRFELCTLAKPFFSAEDLLIAEYDEQILGFLHLGPLADDDWMDAAEGRAAVSALCIVPCDAENSIAKALLAHAERLMSERQVQLCCYKPMLPNNAFYLGLGPGDFMIGATTSEKRSCGWAAAAGFAPVLPTNLWELDLSAFQPPIDRIQIQIRRSALMERMADEPQLPWWQACLLGHTEPSVFQLTHRTDKRLLCEALYWTVASELLGAPESRMWLWPMTIPEEHMGADQVLFLLGESCRQLQNERVDVVRTVSAASDGAASSILRRLGFQPIHSGMVFEKRS